MVVGRILTIAAFAICAVSTLAAKEFPSRPITLVVPFGAGGITDQTARLVAQRISEGTGQPVLVDNRPGGGGSIAAMYVRGATPDGHTLFLASHGTHAINPALYTKWPFDPIKDFEPISTLIELPVVLAVPLEMPAKTPAELVAFAKGKSDTLPYASQGIGSAGHLLGEMLKARTGIDIIPVHYKGTAQALPDVLAGRVSFIFDGVPGVGPLINQGKLRGLAVTATARVPLLKDLPTMAEAGFPGIEFTSWFGLVAPANTPKPVLDRLNAEIVKALQHPNTVDTLARIGAQVAPSSSAEFAARIARDMERLGKVVREIGIQID